VTERPVVRHDDPPMWPLPPLGGQLCPKVTATHLGDGLGGAHDTSGGRRQPLCVVIHRSTVLDPSASTTAASRHLWTRHGLEGDAFG
jgi:hypothetical protein